MFSVRSGNGRISEAPPRRHFPGAQIFSETLEHVDISIETGIWNKNGRLSNPRTFLMNSIYRQALF